MSSLPINQILMTVFATIGLLLPGILKQNSLPGTAKQAINGVIAFAVVIVASIGTAYFANQLQIGNLPADFGVILTGISALLAGPLAPLDQFLVTKVNPGKAGAPQSPPDVTTIVSNLFTELLTSIKELMPAPSVTIHTTQAPIVQTQAPVSVPLVSLPQAVNEAPPVSVSWQAQPSSLGTFINPATNPASSATSTVPNIPIPPAQQFAPLIHREFPHSGSTVGEMPVVQKQPQK